MTGRPADPSPLDDAQPSREGQELDPAALAAYLADKLPGAGGAVTVLQFPRGYSNLTYLVTLGGRELVLRRPPPGVKIKSAHDMGREFRILSALSPRWGKVPRPLLYCEDEAVLGTPFYLMERVRGVVLRATAPAGLDLSPERMRAISVAAVDTLAEIHGLDYRAAGLGELGRPEGYVARQVSGWTERYRKAQTDEVPEMDRLAAWLAGHLPADEGAALIHNDYKYDNLVLAADDPTRVAAVLDWEMATVGDPLNDLGCTLAYWVEAGDPPDLQSLRFGVTNLPGNLTRREVADRYFERTGRADTDLVFHYVCALFKIAVVAQQLYQRYCRGLTKEARFATILDAVRAYGRAGELALNRGRFDRLG